MKKISTLVYTIFISLLILGCAGKERPIEKGKLNDPKRIIVFLDIVKGNEKIFFNKFLPKIEKLISTISVSKNLFSLELYPITRNSSGEDAIVKYELTKEKYDAIGIFKNEPKKQINNIRRQFKQSKKLFETKDTLLSILYTLPLLCERLSLTKKNEKIFVIYFSDLIELHNPSDEYNGRYSFLESRSNNIDILSVGIARQNINNRASKIGEIIERCNKFNYECEIVAFKPNSIPVYSDHDGHQRYEIDDFWRNLFEKLGSPISIQQLSDFDAYFEKNIQN